MKCQFPNCKRQAMHAVGYDEPFCSVHHKTQLKAAKAVIKDYYKRKGKVKPGGKHKLLASILLLAILATAGCNAPPLAAPVIKDAIPPSRELITAEVTALMTTAELVDTQLELDAAKTDAAIKVAQKQSELDIATAKSNAKIAEDSKRAAMERWASAALMGFGLASIVLGAVLAWKGMFRAATTAGLLGLGLVLLSTNLFAIDDVIQWGLRIGLAIGIVVLVVVLAAKGWFWLDTERQKAAKLRAAAKTEDPIEKALLVSDANLLHHMGTKEQDRTKTEVSAEAKAMIEAIP